ncbi:MAG: dockerin type I repeat-containing protein [Prevotella sp.]|nr:dockerin type I repeat-containing protein [Prevotella sp.]
MKHFRLLLTLLALITGGVSVSAQTWTGNEVSEGTFYLYNVGAKGYLIGANNWGTRASVTENGGITVTLALKDGVYTISTAPTYSGAYLGANGYVDRAESESAWSFTPVEGQINVYKISCSAGTLFVDVDAETYTMETSVTSVGTDPNTDYSCWMLISKEERVNNLSNATQDNPLNATFLLTNPNFSQNTNGSGWTMNSSNYNPNGGNNINCCAESWQASFTLSQTIAVPNGYYKLRAQAALTDYTNAYDGTNYPVVYLNDATVPFNNMDETDRGTSMTQLSNSFNSGKYYTEYTNVVTIADNSITVGVKGTRTNTWCIWDNFQLQYLGPIDLSEYVAALAEAVAAAEALQGTVPPVIYSALMNTVNEQNKEYESEEEYSAAIQLINEAVEGAKAYQDAYSKYLTLKSDVQALYDVTGYEELTEGAHEALGTALTTATTNVETCTEIAQINEIAATLKAAGATYAGNANPTGEAQFNLTFMMTNPNLEGMPIRQPADGWSTEQDDGNSQVMTNDAATSEDGTKTAFYEYWTYTAKTNGLFNLYNAVTLPEGTYTINCYAFAQDQYAQTYIKGIYFYANDTQGTCVSSSRLTEQTISFINDQEQEVKIGLKPLTTGNSYNWMGIGYVQLYKVPARTTTYAINVNATNATVITTVDGEETTEALALKTVTLNVTADEGCAITVTATYTEGGTETALEVANPENGVYTFQMPEHDVNVTVVAVVDKTALAAAITAAEAFTEGTLPSSVYTTLTEALATANTVYNNSEATVTEVAAATTALEEAITTANVVKAPFNRYTTIKAAVVAISETVDTTEADSQADAATTAEGIEAAVATVRTALTNYLAGADIKDAQIDITNALVDNANPYVSADYWTVTDADGKAATPNAFDPTNQCAEFWGQAGYSIKQTIATELPLGYYTLTAVAITRTSMTGTLSAGSNTTSIVTMPRTGGTAGVDCLNNRSDCKTFFDAGNGVNELTFKLTEATANLEIGITADKSTSDYWTVWRSFKLEYLGTEPISVLNDQLQAAIDAARTTATELAVPAGVANVLTSLATAYEADKANYTTAAQYTDAIAAIAAAVETAEEAVHPTAYNNLILQKAIITAALDKLADEDEATLQAVIDANTDALAACTNVEEIEARTTVLWTAIADALGSIELAGDETLNLTYLLTNPDLTDCPAWKGAEGWYTDQTDGNSQVMTNDAATSEDGTKTVFYEYWSNPAKANNLFTLYQKVTLPPGTFDISCYAFAQDQYTGQNSVGVYFYANDTQGSSVSNTRLSEASLSFINDTNQEVKIGLKTITGNTYNWMGIGYMELYMVAPNTSEYAINTDQVQNATVVATVDEEVVTTALSLKNVTITVTPAEGFVVENVTVTYNEGEETKNVELSTTAIGTYTFQMPAYDVTVNVTTLVAATEEELNALTEALPTLGFEEGEYAPYTNVEALTAAETEVSKVVAEMEAYNGKATQATVLAATQVISELALTLVANTEEMNAVYDGDFALAEVVETSTDDEITKGWSNPTNIRQIIGTLETFPGLADASAGKAAFSWNGTYDYGRTTGYTMPLKAETTYKFSIKYTGWSGQNLTNGADVYIYAPDGSTLTTEAMGAVENNIANANSLKTYTLEFTTGEAGNYVLGLNPKGNWVFTDVSIFKATAQLGDVNGDTKVDVADITAMVNIIVANGYEKVADLDGDEDVDAEDVKALVNLVLGKE